MHRIIQMAIGVTVAAMMLLLVMVPILDSLTITKIDATEDEDAIYYTMADPSVRYKIATAGTTIDGFTYKKNVLYDMGSKEEIYDLNPLMETLDSKLVCFGDDFALCLQKHMESDTFLRYNYLTYTEFVDEPTSWTSPYTKYSDVYTTIFEAYYENGLWNFEITKSYTYKEITTPVLYIPTTDTDKGQYVSARSMTVKEDGTCTVYQFGWGTSNGSSIAVQYDLTYSDESGEKTGTSNRTNRGLNESCIVYAPESQYRQSNGSSVTAPYTIEKTSDRFSVSLGALEGKVGINTGENDIISYANSFAILAETDQDIVSEYRDIVMVIPVLVAIAILMNVGMMLVYRRN